MRQSWPLVAEPQGPSQRSLGGRATGCSGVHDGKLPTHIYLIVSVLSCILRGLVQVGVTAMNFEIHVAKTNHALCHQTCCTVWTRLPTGL